MKQAPTLSKFWQILVAAITISGCGGGDTPTGNNTPGNGNQNPAAVIAASPLTVPAGDNNQTVVTLDGSGSSDPDGGTITYQWTVPSGTFVQATNASSAVAKVTFPGAAPYVVTLRVSDGQGGTASAQVTIDLGPANPVNSNPVAMINADPTSVPAGDGNTTVVTLDGSASSDPDGDSLTFQWVVQSGTFVNSTTATDAIPQVTFPGLGAYLVTLTVSDGNGATGQAQITIPLT